MTTTAPPCHDAVLRLTEAAFEAAIDGAEDGAATVDVVIRARLRLAHGALETYAEAKPEAMQATALHDGVHQLERAVAGAETDAVLVPARNALQIIQSGVQLGEYPEPDRTDGTPLWEVGV